MTEQNFAVSMFDLLIRTLNFGHLQTRFFQNEGSYQNALDWIKQPF